MSKCQGSEHSKHPYMGYGHQLLAYENPIADITEAQADSVLGADLLERYKYIQRYGKGALLLTVLAYNAGIRVCLAMVAAQRANLIKIESDDRHTYEKYILHRCYKSKPTPNIECSRKREFQLLYISYCYL